MSKNKNSSNTKSSLLSDLPPRKGRYVVVDTETTGLSVKVENIIELACVEIEDGHLSGKQFHVYIKPRVLIKKAAENVHKMKPNFYETLYKDVYESDKQAMINFLAFVGDSLIFAHNALFDMRFINKELIYWGLSPIPESQFRCSVQIFRKLFYPKGAKSSSLINCCQLFGFNITDDKLHTAIYDTFCTARVIFKLFEENESVGKNKENEPIKQSFSGKSYIKSNTNEMNIVIEPKHEIKENEPVKETQENNNNFQSQPLKETNNNKEFQNFDMTKMISENEKIKIDEEVTINLGKYDPVNFLTPAKQDPNNSIVPIGIGHTSQKDIMRKYIDTYQKTKNKERSIEITNVDCGPNSIDDLVAEDWDDIIKEIQESETN